MFLPQKNLSPDTMYDGRQLLPPAVPEEFDQPHWMTNEWVAFERLWTNTPTVPIALSNLTPVEGVVAADALAHLNALQRSQGLTFETKISTIAYLASLWCAQLTYMGITHPAVTVGPELAS